MNTVFRLVLVFLIAGVGSVVGTATQAQQEVATMPLHARLEQLAKRTPNLEEFGRSVVQHVLLAAAKQLREEKASESPVSVTLDFLVTELPSKYPPIDVCYEMCGGLACYVQCDVGSIDIDADRAIEQFRARQRQCEELRESLQEAMADGRAKRMTLIRLQMWTNGCISLEELLVRLTANR